MGFLNLGKKDEYGRQRRIEHRGRHLRASRSGGVALRAQTKAAGLNFTANTAQGLRVSATPAKNTQVALQNGRFVLRGRYGSGPFRLNLSKSGLSLSARNPLGSVNLTNPMRSSAKVAGIQFRGRTAAWMQAVYGVVVLVVGLVRVAFALALLALQVVLFVAGLVLRGGAAVPVIYREWRRRRRAAGLARRADAVEAAHASLGEWSLDRWIAAVLLIVAGRGRGEDAAAEAARQAKALANGDGPKGLGEAVAVLEETGEVLDALRGRMDADGDPDLVLLVVAARRLGERLPAETVAEILLEVDEQALAAGPRTRLQDRMLEVFADCAGLRLAPAEEEEAPVEATDRSGDGAAIDINRADIETLQCIPHVGEERARAIIGMRPLERLEDLAAVDGIGPKTLQAMREHGVVCGEARPV